MSFFGIGSDNELQAFEQWDAMGGWDEYPSYSSWGKTNFNERVYCKSIKNNGSEIIIVTNTDQKLSIGLNVVKKLSYKEQWVELNRTIWKRIVEADKKLVESTKKIKFPTGAKK